METPTNPKNENLHNWIKIQLRARGWNQKMLSDRMGMSASTISRLGVNAELPRLDTLVALAEALGTTRNEVLAIAGIIEPTGTGTKPDTLASIATDPALSEAARSALSILYRELAATGRAHV